MNTPVWQARAVEDIPAAEDNEKSCLWGEMISVQHTKSPEMKGALMSFGILFSSADSPQHTHGGGGSDNEPTLSTSVWR